MRGAPRLSPRPRARLRSRASDLAAIVLFNPVNIRYACDARNMQVYGLHNPCRYVCITADGHTTLFEFRNCEHLSRHLETVDEIRPAKAWYHMAAGPNAAAAASGVRARDRRARRASAAVAARAASRSTGSTPPARRRSRPKVSSPVDGLAAARLRARDQVGGRDQGDVPTRFAPASKALRRMQAAHRPGITEQALWSVLVPRQCRARRRMDGDAAAVRRARTQSLVQRDAATT